MHPLIVEEWLAGTPPSGKRSLERVSHHVDANLRQRDAAHRAARGAIADPGRSTSGAEQSAQSWCSDGQSSRRGSTPKCASRSPTTSGSNWVPAQTSISWMASTDDWTGTCARGWVITS